MSEINTTQDIRSSFLKFFQDRGHTLVPAVPLLAKNDPSLLFVNSGMVPFKDCFTGKEKRDYARATSCQKSLRVSGKHNDYEQIGTTPRHHTFFEMLGNFSFGDYSKSQAISFAWEYVTEVLKLDKNKLWVTIHQVDDEAKKLWSELTDIDPSRIVKLGDDTNRWAMGEIGPNGYCSEIFYYMGDNPANQSLEDFLKDDGTYLEIWNLVFMQFNKKADGTIEDLPKPCIDTGMGLERVAAIVAGVKSNYDTDSIKAIINQVEKISNKKYKGDVYNLPHGQGDAQYQIDVAMRVIADHSRAIAFLIADGVSPSNEAEGYVLRRLIRRSIRFGQVLGIEENFLAKTLKVVIHTMGEFYKELKENKKMIDRLITAEENQFQITLKNGIKLLDEELQNLKAGDILSGKIAFKLYDTYGFPLDLTQEILLAKKISVNTVEFNKALEVQKERSRLSRDSKINETETTLDNFPATEFLGYDYFESKAKLLAFEIDEQKKQAKLLFDKTPYYAEKGGQVGDTGTIEKDNLQIQIIDTKVFVGGQIVHLTKDISKLNESFIGKEFLLKIDRNKRLDIASHHSGTHLLNAGLREVLGTHIQQRGSLVENNRLRFDFSHFEAVKPDEIEKIQSFVNDTIQENYEVITKEMPIDEAVKSGAVATFGEKYGSVVRVVEMGPSKELCGGTHTKRTGDIGLLLITSESSISAGVRRIEALCGKAALDFIKSQQKTIVQIADTLKAKPQDLGLKIATLLEQQNELKNDIKKKDLEIAKFISNNLLNGFSRNGKTPLIAESIDVEGRDTLVAVVDLTLEKLKSGVVALASKKDKLIIIKVSKDNIDNNNANELVKKTIEKIGSGKGGGKPEMATLANIEVADFEKVLKVIKEIVL